MDGNATGPPMRKRDFRWSTEHSQGKDWKLLMVHYEVEQNFPIKIPKTCLKPKKGTQEKKSVIKLGSTKITTPSSPLINLTGVPYALWSQQALWSQLLSELQLTRIFGMHVCFVRQVRLEPEAVKLRCLALHCLVRGQVRGAKQWRKTEGFGWGKVRRCHCSSCSSRIYWCNILRWDAPPITY